MDHFMPDAM